MKLAPPFPRARKASALPAQRDIAHNLVFIRHQMALFGRQYPARSRFSLEEQFFDCAGHVVEVLRAYRFSASQTQSPVILLMVSWFFFLILPSVRQFRADWGILVLDGAHR